MVRGGLVMVAPAEEQSVVGPFFERSRPMCGSLAVLGLGELRPPLSGSPIPPSHAAVTIWLPAGPPHSAAVPMNTNGTALDDDWAGEVAGLRAPKTTTIPAAIPIRRERLTRVCAVPLRVTCWLSWLRALMRTCGAGLLTASLTMGSSEID